METLTISQLANLAGVNVETVRYYERRGLIPEPPRCQSGYRQYTPDYAARIRFIKRAQDLGFSLNEIADLLAFRIETESACGEVKRQAELKIADIKSKISTLQNMQQALEDLVVVCDEKGSTGECPILDALEGGGAF